MGIAWTVLFLLLLAAFYRVASSSM